MKAQILLRIAAVIMFLHAVGHTIGVLTWREPMSDQHTEVIKMMNEVRFEFMGSAGSMGKYYEGFGYACTLAMLFIVAVLWIVSSADANAKKISSKIILATSFVLLVWGILELVYFFPFAASFSIVSSALGFYSMTRFKSA